MEGLAWFQSSPFFDTPQSSQKQVWDKRGDKILNREVSHKLIRGTQFWGGLYVTLIFHAFVSGLKWVKCPSGSNVDYWLIIIINYGLIITMVGLLTHHMLLICWQAEGQPADSMAFHRSTAHFPKSPGELQPLATDVCEYLEHNMWQSLFASHPRGLCAGLSPRTCGCSWLSSAKLMMKVRKRMSEEGLSVRAQVRDGERHLLPAVLVSWEVPQGSVLTSPPLLLGLRTWGFQKMAQINSSLFFICSPCLLGPPWPRPTNFPLDYSSPSLWGHPSIATPHRLAWAQTPQPGSGPCASLWPLHGGYPPVPTPMCQHLPSPPAPASPGEGLPMRSP